MIGSSPSFTGTSPDVYYQFARLQSMTQWWHWLVLVAACAAVLAYVAVQYYRDGVELGAARRYGLLALRIAAFAGILFFFLDLEKRTQRRVVKNSRAILLVDTSLSMGIQEEAGSVARRRIDAAIDEFEQNEILARLREKHDVVVYRFDQGAAPAELASFPKLPRDESQDDGGRQVAGGDAVLWEARTTAAVAAGILLLAVLAALCILALAPHAEQRAWAVVVGIVGLLTAAVVLSVAHLRHPEIGFLATIGLASPAAPVEEADDGGQQLESSEVIVDWPAVLAPQGAETRLGDALLSLIQKERDGPLAGLLVLTDGGSNAGVGVDQAVAAARSAGIPVFPIGFGGAQRPANARIVDLEAPARVYPGDSFTLNGYVQAFGLAGRTVRLEVVSRPVEAPEDLPMTVRSQRSLRLGNDGEVTPVRFELTPDVLGEYLFAVRLVPPREDQDPRDDQRTAKVEVVDRKNRVLLIAGGPSREYRFLRDLLYRDRDTTLHVLLQSGQPGMSQEADRLLFEFPSTAEELFEYDTIVAFDPDWLALDDLQVQLMERWVSEEAGGLIVVAGPVHTPQWASRLDNDPRTDTIRGLYPVVFYSRGLSTLSLGRFASEVAWPLEFTRDGEDAEFLGLEDDPLLSRQAWDEFQGVYGYYAVKDPKLGARIFCRFSDPSTAIDGELPIYMAGHFYGAGRVFFQASGEMWRIRAINDAFFEKYYTKLLRWVSQGRLLRDSSRGVLMVDKERCLLGDHVGVRAILTDAQHEPLLAAQVGAMLTDPTGLASPLVLRRVEDAARPGMYTAQFTTALEGDYRVELQPPHAEEGEVLVREVQSRIPALETERPERNDALLTDLAEQTGGAYFVGLHAAMNRQGQSQAPVYNLLPSQDQVSFVSGTPDRNFERILMTWLLGFICGSLCLEWLIRRLNRLA